MNRNFPQAKNHIEKIYFGSPLTAKHYLGSANGESYGLSHTVDRYCDFEISRTLAPKTPIQNFYLTGQDCISAGLYLFLSICLFLWCFFI